MKTITFLDGIKSGYSVLVICATLLLGVSACSSEEFGIEVPEVKKEWTKQELIELALSQMAEIRGAKHPASMISIKDTVSIKCYASKEMTINWGDEDDNEETTVPPNSNVTYTHVYTDGRPCHLIYIKGSMEAYLDLNVNNNKLISLNVNASHVSCLYCENNHLDSLDLAGGPVLQKLFADNNELSLLDVSQASMLMDLRASHNRLKEIQLPKYSPSFYTLMLSDNRIKEIDMTCYKSLRTLLLDDNLITDLDLSTNPYLVHIYLNNLPLKTFNGDSVGAGDFSMYKGLRRIFLVNTPFTSLSLPQNSSINWIDISETSITTLDITTLNNLAYLYASYSKLTDLEYDSYKLKNGKLCDVRIERTPFENIFENNKKITDFTVAFPENANPGTLYTYSDYLSFISSSMAGKNWIINP